MNDYRRLLTAWLPYLLPVLLLSALWLYLVATDAPVEWLVPDPVSMPLVKQEEISALPTVRTLIYRRTQLYGSYRCLQTGACPILRIPTPVRLLQHLMTWCSLA